MGADYTAFVYLIWQLIWNCLNVLNRVADPIVKD
jgi:hypothetical protein